jgi:hypothetical protein
MNHDGRPDVLALGESPGAVEWVENPGSMDRPWPRHPISAGLTERNIDLAVYDVDRDGRPDVAVASDFDLGNSNAGGTVSWLRRTGPGGGEWAAVKLFAEPTAHRIRWADVDGDGRKELITVPILGRGAKPPGYEQAPVRILCHRIPRDPVHEAWPAEVIAAHLHVVHGVAVVDWDGDGRDEILTASNEGLFLFKAEGQGPNLRWSHQQLARGHEGHAPNQGASEVCVGREHGQRFLATIEPWHGNEVVVYTPPPKEAGSMWRRQVIDDSLRAGHALCCVDLDGDGIDEIIAGYRGEGSSLNGYRRAPAAGQWKRFTIDRGGMAAQGCVTADINGDGLPDVIAAGGTTHNVKIYLGQRP